MKEQIIDTRGLMCPEPILKAETEVRQLEIATEILVLATDLASPIDFEVWCLHKGHDYLGFENKEQWLEIRFRTNFA
ncbi:MAG: tRNA 2-thiouridine synthesizing protein A [Rhodothermales bacterium]|jgi:tRNA 2-thiouridine synthesizing protein A